MAWFTAPQELHDLAFRYGQAVDTRDAAALGRVFTLDGAIVSYPQEQVRYRGAQGWARMIAEVSGSFQQTMHNVFNQTFDRDDAGVITGLTTGIASHLMQTDGAGLVVVDFAMRYHNLYAVEDGAWKFARRAMDVVWTETRPVTPFSPAMFGRELAQFR